jgi:hypothetical protein
VTDIINNIIDLTKDTEEESKPKSKSSRYDLRETT